MIKNNVLLLVIAVNPIPSSFKHRRIIGFCHLVQDALNSENMELQARIKVLNWGQLGVTIHSHALGHFRKFFSSIEVLDQHPFLIILARSGL